MLAGQRQSSRFPTKLTDLQPCLLRSGAPSSRPGSQASQTPSRPFGAVTARQLPVRPRLRDARPSLMTSIKAKIRTAPISTPRTQEISAFEASASSPLGRAQTAPFVVRLEEILGTGGRPP